MKEFEIGNSAEPVTFPDEFLRTGKQVESFVTEEIPASHPAEPDLFARHKNIPGHNQVLLRDARIVLAGAGGLNSWTAVSLVRGGAGSLAVIDHDRVDRTNLSRQFFVQEDLGQPKAISLAKNLTDQAVGGATITGIALPFEEAIKEYPLPADILVIGVDNNACRLEAVRHARRRRIPAVFTMLSRDGMRCQCFLQSPSKLDPCLWCALPNLDPEKTMPCASAIISSCLLASAFTVFFVHRAVMGWGNIEPFNWREADLSGMVPDKKGSIARRNDCRICKNL
jgi:adenylyltransferase/sulfurtransferase